MLDPLPLTLCIGRYDHTRDLTDGTVPVEGVRLRAFHLPIEETFHRFILHREWEASEVSMGKYVAMRSQGDASIVAIPVFVSRAFRHSMFYVRAGGPIGRPEDLQGKRVGVPEWAQTATIYARGYLAEYVGVRLDSIDWVQAGVNQPGRAEKVALKLPAGLRYRSEPTRTLNDMLLAGELDCVLSARPPAALGAGIERLFPEYQAAEEQYHRDTGIFPIMHGVVFRADVLDAHPWVAMNFQKAFEEAKRRSLERMSEVTASYAPLAWLADYSTRLRALFGADPFPYGLEPNYTTLDAFLRFGHEQGVCHTRLAPESLFPRSVLSAFKV